VKCDEAKPGCLRCVKFGRDCDGYVVKKKIPAARQQGKRSDSKIRTLAPIAMLVPGMGSCPPRVPTTIIFSNENEERYFRGFHDETAGSLSGGFDAPLWNRIVLQACHDEPCILHGAIAIAALDRACKAKHIQSLSHTSEMHHQYALQQYSRALRGLHDAVSRRGDSLRTALISSLLIFCFENFHGDIRLALVNVRSAVDLMHSWLAQNVNLASVTGFSPRPHVIEHELVLAYARLDVHLMSWMDTPQIQRTPILSYVVTQPSPIPSSFGSLVEAKECFEHIANRVFQYLADIHTHGHQGDAVSHNEVYGGTTGVLQELAVAVELRAWMAAFDPVLKNANPVDFVGANTLRIHALTLHISLRSVFYSLAPNNTQFNIFLPEYCEIVALAKGITSHPSFVRSFVFEAGIVPSLFVVVAKCTDSMLRQELIDVLHKASPRREGVWDAFMVAKIGRELLKFENGETEKGGWVEVHLQCVHTTFVLPAPESGNQGNPNGADLYTQQDSRKYLLDWVEQTMKVDVISEEPRYGRRDGLTLPGLADPTTA